MKIAWLALAVALVSPGTVSAQALIDKNLDILGGNSQPPCIGADTLGSGGGVAATGGQGCSQGTTTSAMMGASGFLNSAAANSGTSTPGVAANDNGVNGANSLGLTSIGSGIGLGTIVSSTGTGTPN